MADEPTIDSGSTIAGRVAQDNGRLDFSLHADTAAATSPETGPEVMRATAPRSRLGDYKIVREIGRGGMGIVFEAIQLSLNRRVALKVLPLGCETSPTRIERFEREALAVAHLEHPRIASAYTHGKLEGVYCLAMQYIDGENLSRFVSRQRRLLSGSERPTSDRDTVAERSHSEPAAVDPASVRRPEINRQASPTEYFAAVATMGYQAADAIAYAHGQGIIHRDIKPSNLILDRDGNLSIADFGLALMDSSDALTATGQPLGTLRYSSPEQAVGDREITAATDIYSLGATLYELATLRPPYLQLSPVAMLHQIIERSPVAPRVLDPSVPADLECIILKAMSKRPRDRYASAAELAADLQRFVNHEPILARPPSAIRLGLHWFRRNPLYGMTVLLAVLLLLTVLGELIVLNLQRSRFVRELSTKNVQLQDLLEKKRRESLVLEQQRSELESHYYAAEMESLGRLVQNKQFSALARQLEQDRRLRPGRQTSHGFLARYLRSFVNPSVQTLRAHDDPVLSSAYCQRRSVLVTGDKNDRILVWDTRSWQVIAEMAFPGEVRDLEFSPDQNLLVAAGSGGELRIFRCDDWQLVHGMVEHQDAIQGIAFTPDGRQLISGARDGRVIFWDTTTWRPTRTTDAHDKVYDVSVSGDGMWLVTSGSDCRTRVWKIATGELDGDFCQHEQTVLKTAISRDGRLIASGGYDDRVVIWDRESKEQLARVSIDEQTWCLEFLHDENVLAVGTNFGTVCLFDLDNPRQPELSREIHAESGWVRSLSWLEGQDLLATTGQDGSIQLFKGPVAPVHRRFATPTVRQIRFSPDGKQFAAAEYEGGFAVYEAAAPQRATPIRLDPQWEGLIDKVRQVSYLPDGRLRISAIRNDYRAVLVMTIDQGQRQSHELHFDADLERFFLSANGRLGVSVETNRRLTLWDLHSFTAITSFHTPDKVNDVAFSPTDANCLAIACRAGDKGYSDIFLKDGDHPSLQQPLFHQTQHGLYTLDFSPDGTTLAAAGYYGRILLWDVSTREPAGSIEAGEQIVSLCFSNDGRHLATGGNQLKLWHVPTGRMLIHLGPKYEWKRYETLAFAPDNRVLVTAADRVEHSELHLFGTPERPREESPQP